MKNIFLLNSFLGLWLLSIFNANGIAIINITKNKQIIEFSIFDLDGKLIECGFGYDVVSVNNIFKSGLYIVKIQSKQGSKVIKISKNDP